MNALLFDVFGTVVDWRGSIIADGAGWGRAVFRLSVFTPSEWGEMYGIRG